MVAQRGRKEKKGLLHDQPCVDKRMKQMSSAPGSYGVMTVGSQDKGIGKPDKLVFEGTLQIPGILCKGPSNICSMSDQVRRLLARERED